MINKVNIVIKKIIKKPHVILLYLGNAGLFNWMSDRMYIQCRYFGYNGSWLNLKNPQRFNEKLQWMKLYYRKNEFIQMVDKARAKQYVASVIGEEYIIPTIGVWNSYREIDFKQLPNQFVLKTTHDSGGVVLVENKSKILYEEVEKKINKSMRTSYYKVGREWVYKSVKPQIIAEEFLGSNIQDYKLFCFNGKVRMTLVCSERFTDSGLCEDFFDNDWNHMDLRRPKHDNLQRLIKKPENFRQMKEMAEKLAKGIPFVRIDFYEVEGKVYFGEITFYPASGFEGFKPKEWDEILGGWLELPNIERIV